MREETLVAQILQEQLDAVRLELPIIYHYFNELCEHVQILDACIVSGCLTSTGIVRTDSLRLRTSILIHL